MNPNFGLFLSHSKHLEFSIIVFELEEFRLGNFDICNAQDLKDAVGLHRMGILAILTRRLLIIIS
jgi:hypothetical protein